MLHLARYYSYEGALLILGPWNGDAPPVAEMVGVGVLDELGVRVADEIMSSRRHPSTRRASGVSAHGRNQRERTTEKAPA